MVMLGAQLEDLNALASQLETSTGRLGEVNDSCQKIQTSICGDMEAAFSAAVGRVESTMADMRSVVTEGQASLDSTVWTGGNRQQFDAASGDFASSMSALEGSISDTWTTFNDQVHHMSGLLAQFQVELSTHLGHAQESTANMSKAVIMQHDNLDSAMNGATV